MEQKPLVSANDLRVMIKELQDAIDIANWNATVESIERNAKSSLIIAWSNSFLNDNQVKKMTDLGYILTRSEGSNNCHKITW
jgi:hypothetical protein